ncbi:non-classical arabinogalactan protein 31 [Cornus florida]|uniref:non-classical arabinogalactan protein 31 n=1 Tax=Cornus florida TaxID=4283 RepID=UPI00289D2E9E|nr:non-classical arabinogalactan protein 31 [Cornus florida]
MVFVEAKTLLLVQVSVVLLSCLNVSGDELDTVSLAQSPLHHAPSYPPVESPKHPKGHHPGHHHHKAHPPSQPPTHPPTHSPVHTPMTPPTHHHHHKGHPPSQPPTHPPTQSPSHPPMTHPRHPPVHTPISPPSHPPTHHLPTRNLMAVQGVVYCKPCKYTGVETLLGASPLLGAVVKLQCNNTKYPLVQEAKTDKNGYFMLSPKKVTTYAFHKCKVFIVSSPMATCNKPTNLHGGLNGAVLMPHKQPPPPPTQPLPFQLFSVGPFAFESSGKTKCTP